MKAHFSDFTFVYMDAEFTPDDPSPAGLVSLALHSEHGSLHRVNAEADGERFCASVFRRDHIWSKLPLRGSGRLDLLHPDVVAYADIREEVDLYFRKLTQGHDYRRKVGLIADHGTQDMQRIHDLWGGDWGPDGMPEWIPKRLFADLATLEDLAGAANGFLPDGTPLPENPPEEAHHALVDAKYDRRVHEFLLERSRAVRIASGVELAVD